MEQAVLISLWFCFRSPSAGRGSVCLCVCVSGWHSHRHCSIRHEKFYDLPCPQRLCLHLFIVTTVMRAGKGQIISPTTPYFMCTVSEMHAENLYSWCLSRNGVQLPMYSIYHVLGNHTHYVYFRKSQALKMVSGVWSQKNLLAFDDVLLKCLYTLSSH